MAPTNDSGTATKGKLAATHHHLRWRTAKDTAAIHDRSPRGSKRKSGNQSRSRVAKTPIRKAMDETTTAGPDHRRDIFAEWDPSPSAVMADCINSSEACIAHAQFGDVTTIKPPSAAYSGRAPPPAPRTPAFPRSAPGSRSRRRPARAGRRCWSRRPGPRRRRPTGFRRRSCRSR